MDTFGQANDRSRDNPSGANKSTPNGLQSIGLLQQLSEDPSAVSKTDLIGLLGGGALGLYISTKFPKAVVKYIGIIVGAELGIMIVRAMKTPKGSV
jgi:NAD kinase